MLGTLMRKIGCLPMPAYLHIPKTGGTYLAQYESDEKSVIQPIKKLGHVCVIDENLKEHPNFPPLGFVEKRSVSIQEIKNFYIFSTVRNIFDWFVSYAGHAGGWNPKYVDVNHYDYGNVQKGFDYLLKTIANREDLWPCRKFIHFQLFCDNGGLVADWINRTETLDDDLKDMAQYLKIKYQKKAPQRVGGHKDYRSYYNDSLIDLVYQTWGRELKLFGYNFDGLDISSALLKKNIDEKTKEGIKYYWHTDKLLSNGEESINANG